jgi:drug/metabolite transporter (DMT)-like permease
MSNANNLPKVYLRLVLTALCWGAMFHVARHVVAVLSPLATGAWRFGLAYLLFMPLVAWREGWDWSGIRRHGLVLLVMAVVGVFGFNIGLFYGLQSTSAVNGALIMGLNPALTAVLAALIQRRLPSAAQFAGLLLGTTGVALVVSHGSWQTLASLTLGRGDAFVLAGALCWALYSALPQRFIHGLSPLQVAGSTIIGGAVCMILLALDAAPDLHRVPTPLAGLGIAFMAVFGSVLAYLWWNDGVKVVGPTQAAVFLNFVPIFAALIGVASGQPLSAAQLMGAGLVVGGVLVSVLLHRRAPTAVTQSGSAIALRT